ncbi:MAG: ABC transporter ATP-binding protein [Candidatus Heimdallarchaeaceae archaeon]
MVKLISKKTVAKDTEAQLTVGILINKLNRDTLSSLVNKLKNYLKRVLKAKDFEVKEVNTFLFIYCDFPLEEVKTEEQRKEVITQVERIMQNYCGSEGNSYAKKIQQNIEIKDITKMLFRLIRNSQTENQKEIIDEIKEITDKIDERVVSSVTNIILHSFLAVWDFPKDIPDIIMFPDLILKREIEDKKEQSSLRIVAENLMILQFGKVCLENLNPILSSVSEAVNSLHEFFFNSTKIKVIEQNMTDKLWRTIRVIFGLLSSTQQVIAIQLKQIKRIIDVKEDLKLQVKELEYFSLMDYIMLLDSTLDCEKSIDKLNMIRLKVKETYQLLLNLINKFKDLPGEKTTDVKDLVLIFTNVLSEIQLLKFFSDKFKDLAYFQTIPIEVQIEEEKEIEVPPELLMKGVALFKTYQLLGSTVYALRGIDIEIKQGEMIAIVGPSGSGKTTLLNLLSGLDSPERGAVFLQGKNINMMKDSELSIFRRKHIGFIFQYYNLIPQLTVLENVMLPGLMAGKPSRSVRKKALELIKAVNLEKFQNQFPIKLSGGQMQRVTIARAMVNDPLILFADEPTGDLDSVTGKIVIDLIKKISKEKGTAVVLVTHDLNMAKICDRIVEIIDGRIISN